MENVYLNKLKIKIKLNPNGRDREEERLRGKKGERGTERKTAIGLHPVVSSASLRRFRRRLRPLPLAAFLSSESIPRALTIKYVLPVLLCLRQLRFWNMRLVEGFLVQIKNDYIFPHVASHKK